MANKCPNCNINLKEKISEGSLSMECPKCGYNYTRQYVKPIYEDTTDYTIFIVKSEKTRDNMKVLSKLTGHNYQECIKILSSEKTELFNGRAPEVLLKINELSKTNLNYTIEPNFKWNK